MQADPLSGVWGRSGRGGEVARAGLGPDEVEEAAEGGAGGLEVRGEGLQAAELVRQLARVQLHLPISKRGINSV
jgi:hypothetical protein